MATQMHTVASGDTIHRIAYTYGVSWRAIVEANGLTMPYVDSSQFSDYEDVDTVATCGNVLVIPDSSSVVPARPNGDIDALAAISYGCDLDILFHDSDKVHALELRGELLHSSSGDVQLSSGIHNLRQQLMLRLGTPKGSLPLHPEYGTNINKYIGKRASVDLLTKIQLEVKEALLSDFRVSGVGDVRVRMADSVITVDADVYPIDPYHVFQLQQSYEMR